MFGTLKHYNIYHFERVLLMTLLYIHDELIFLYVMNKETIIIKIMLKITI